MFLLLIKFICDSNHSYLITHLESLRIRFLLIYQDECILKKDKVHKNDLVQTFFLPKMCCSDIHYKYVIKGNKVPNLLLKLIEQINPLANNYLKYI